MTILALALTFLLFADADVPQVNSLRPPASSNLGTLPGDEIPLFGNEASDSDQQNPSSAQDKSQSGSKNTSLQDSSRLNLIRYVSGEFARAIKPLPAGKDGFIVHIGQPTDFDMLDRQVATHGAAVSTGDHVQITKLEFHDRQIVVDLNGGGPTTRTTTTTPQDSGPPGMQPGLGSTLFLEFGKPLPDLSPDDLKKLLAPFLDFTKQRSASVQWADSLPVEMKKAIQERIAIVGMDREEVVAAIGKPEHKVRERDAEGNDIEDWIYGQPPSKTVFVRFTGTRVTSVKQYPQ